MIQRALLHLIKAASTKARAQADLAPQVATVPVGPLAPAHAIHNENSPRLRVQYTAGPSIFQWTLMQTGDLAGAMGLSHNFLCFDQQRALLRAGDGCRDYRSQAASWR